MSRILLIIDSEYPYGLGESFLENEMCYFGQFDRVILYPCFCGAIENKRNLYDTHFEVVRPDTKFSKDDKFARVMHIIKVAFSKTAISELVKLLKQHKLNIHSIMHMLSFLSKGNYYYSFINNWIKEHTCSDDDIYIYAYWLYYQTYIGTKLKKSLNVKKFISRAHGFDLYEYRNKNNYIPLREITLSGVDCIYTISQDGRDYLSKLYPYYADKIKVSRLGTFDHGIKQYRKNKFCIRIVSCSWMVSVKRIDRIIESLSRITDINIEWIHFGDGQKFSELRDLAEKKLPENILWVFKGATPNIKIIEYYKSTYVDVFVNVSESEGIPVSIMEALSFGIPVIATKVGGVSELVCDGKNGYLLSSDFKCEQLISSVKKIATMSIENYEVMCKNARISWEENYNADINYKALVGEILNESVD